MVSVGHPPRSLSQGYLFPLVACAGKVKKSDPSSLVHARTPSLPFPTSCLISAFTNASFQDLWIDRTLKKYCLRFPYHFSGWFWDSGRHSSFIRLRNFWSDSWKYNFQIASWGTFRVRPQVKNFYWIAIQTLGSLLVWLDPALLAVLTSSWQVDSTWQGVGSFREPPQWPWPGPSPLLYPSAA